MILVTEIITYPLYRSPSLFRKVEIRYSTTILNLAWRVCKSARRKGTRAPKGRAAIHYVHVIEGILFPPLDYLMGVSRQPGLHAPRYQIMPCPRAWQHHHMCSGDLSRRPRTARSTPLTMCGKIARNARETKII